MYPVSYQPSGQINELRAREFYVNQFIDQPFNPELIYRFQLNIDNKKLAQFALDVEKNENSIKSGNNVGGYHSSFMLFDNYPDNILIELHDQIVLCVNKIIKRDIKIVQSWVNINRNGHKMKRHNHSQVPIVACYYVTDYDNMGGELIITKTGEKIQPIGGQLLIFSGDLYHEVLSYTGDDVRISIACNII